MAKNVAAAAYAAALAQNPGLLEKLDADLETVFLPARAAYERTPASLPERHRWSLARDKLLEE